MPNRRIVALALLAALAAWPAGAGMYYKSRSWQEGAGAQKTMNMDVEAWIDGDRGKFLFTESGNPWMTEGSYLLTTDGGQTLYLVNPKDKVYSEWDLDAILKFAGGVMQGMKGVFSMQFVDPRVETLLTEPGPTIFGFPTTHYRYRTTYGIEMKILGMKRSQDVDMIQDIWSTESIADAAFGVWQRREPPKTGDPELDRLIALEAGKIKGFPLKTVQTQTSTTKKGKESEVQTLTEVTELRSEAVDPSIFVIPSDYQQTRLMPTEEELAGQQPADPDEEEGGKKKRKGLGALLRGDG